MLTDELKTQIEETLAAHPVLLFMKGTPDFPQCGFSAQAVAALLGYRFRRTVTAEVTLPIDFVVRKQSREASRPAGVAAHRRMLRDGKLESAVGFVKKQKAGECQQRNSQCVIEHSLPLPWPPTKNVGSPLVLVKLLLVDGSPVTD